MPRDTFSRHRLLDTYQRLFPEATKEDIDRFAALFDAAVDQRHGSMLIVAKEAGAKANLLGGQGTQIDRIVLTPDLYHHVSCIDGAVIIDPHGVCHAIGVILDGPARPEGTASRGARCNSTIRYVGSSDVPRLAVVVSDDDTVAVIPVLMPQIRRSYVKMAMSEIETATSENYNSAIGWLSRHRFYLNQEQCNRVNAAVSHKLGVIRDWLLFFLEYLDQAKQAFV